MQTVAFAGAGAPLGSLLPLVYPEKQNKKWAGKPGMKVVGIALKLFMIKMEVVWEAQHTDSTAAHMPTLCSKNMV